MKAIALLMVLALIGCGDGNGVLGLGYEDCDKKMNETVATYGQPDKVTKYDSGTYHSWTWYYNRYKFIKAFTWDDDMDCQADTFTY